MLEKKVTKVDEKKKIQEIKKCYEYLVCEGEYCPDTIQQINDSQFIKRVGIIPYYKNENGVLMLLGFVNDEFIDLGGGCDVGEKPFICGIRELREESRGLVDIDLNNITHAFLSGYEPPYRVVLLIQLQDIDKDINTKFQNIQSLTKEEDEIDDLVWISYNNFKNRIANDREVHMTLRELDDKLPENI